MSFVQTAEWSVESRRTQLPRLSETKVVLPLIGSPVRKGFAAVGSILIHVLLLYLFVTKLLSGADTVHALGSNEESLKLFDISDVKEAPKAQKEPSAAPSKPEASDTTPPVPIEWKVARIAKTLAVSSASPATAIVQPGSSGTGSSPSAGGGGDYDPYAGAAPLRMYTSNVNGVGSTPSLPQKPTQPSGTIIFDERILERIRLEARRTIGGRLPVTMTITIGLDGQLKDTQFSGMTAEAARRMNEYLKRRRFFTVVGALSQPQTHTIMLR